MKKNNSKSERENQPKVNVYQLVTDRIVEQLAKGVVPWQKPWSGAGLSDGGAINYVSRKPYSQLNQMLLGRGGEYLTFKQVKEQGGNIRKGAKSGMVVFTTQYKVKTTRLVKDTEDGEPREEEVEKTVPVLRYYNVFHIEDCEGVESKIKVDEAGNIEPTLKPVEEAETIINGYLSRENHLQFHNDQPSNRAFYSPSLDSVTVPMLSQYQIVEEYYSTTFHELVHSTGTPGRCDRKSEVKGIAAFGNENYSREELVAEMGAAMLCNHVGLDCDKAFKNSVAYIQGWLKQLKNDNRMIVWAASRAEKAAKYIVGER